MDMETQLHGSILLTDKEIRLRFRVERRGDGRRVSRLPAGGHPPTRSGALTGFRPRAPLSHVT